MENQKLEFKLNKRKLKFSQKRYTGFTLIEMAIVLVIIGLIIGAVLKGQDLIDNARAKKFTNFIRQGEIAQWTFFDRHGHFAGDDNANGKIGCVADDIDVNGQPNDSEAFANYDFTQKLSLGGSSFYIRFGQYGTASDPARAVIVVTKSDTGATAGDTYLFSASEAEWCRSFDTAIDNTSSPTNGKVIALDAVALTYQGSYDTYLVSDAEPDGTYPSINGTGSLRACVYFFADNGLP